MSLTKEWTAQVGMFVRAQVPASKQTDATAFGRIDAIESLTDDNGTRRWVIVRWIDDAGLPEREARRHSIEELEPLEE